MSTLQRINWLIQEISSGRNAFVTFSFNKKTRKEKITFKLDRYYHDTAVYRPCVLGALWAAHAAVQSSISTDKGHTSKSSGCTVVEFWLQQPGNDADNAKNDAGASTMHVSEKTLDSHGIADPTIAASSSLDIGVEGNSANSSLDGGMAENVAPPCKRVRFSLQDEVSFVDADTLAPQSLV